MLNAKELQNLKIESLHNGMDRIVEIDHRLAELNFEMRQEGSIPVWQTLCDEHYELRKAKRAIQHKMGKLVVVK